MARLAVRSLFIALVTLVMIEGAGTESEKLESPPRPYQVGSTHQCTMHVGRYAYTCFVFSVL